MTAAARHVSVSDSFNAAGGPNGNFPNPKRMTAQQQPQVRNQGAERSRSRGEYDESVADTISRWDRQASNKDICLPTARPYSRSRLALRHRLEDPDIQ